MLLLSYGGVMQETKALLVAWEEEWSLLMGRAQFTAACAATTPAGEDSATTAVACAAALAIGGMAASGGHSISTAGVYSAAVVLGRTHRLLVGVDFPAFVGIGMVL
jgi:hypothetical protein